MAAQERLTLRNAYLYLVCLITLVVSLFAAVQLVRSAVGAFYPDPGYYGYYPYESPDGSRESPSEEEIERQQQLAEDSQRRQEVLGLVGSATTLLVAGPLYVYHWRRVQAELPARSAQEPTAAPPAP
ncbi:hypothetical protein [Blastococcus saxobsidens]|uniref:DUF5671 domain-containing protein n=1 Tax=Blastococcus saxobsidens TaxID=138336 RepID=A0A4V2G1W0_9ACTN|nr:hypothetical protein [Blastococcus saxobsidens]RZU30726.1 hypothetical protein BKA19_0352 [Blastococcus saxobsidens]